jgi:hypothetical protein
MRHRGGYPGLLIGPLEEQETSLERSVRRNLPVRTDSQQEEARKKDLVRTGEILTSAKTVLSFPSSLPWIEPCHIETFPDISDASDIGTAC